MNALVPQSAKPGGFQGALETCDAKFIDPLDHHLWTSETYKEMQELAYSWPLDPATAGPAARSSAARFLAIGPNLADLDRHLAILTEAIDAATDARSSRAMIGLLVDCFPSSRPPNLDAYCSALLHDVLSLRYSPYELAAACRSIRRSAKFAPAISELLAACAEAREWLRVRRSGLERIRRQITTAQALVNCATSVRGVDGRP